MTLSFLSRKVKTLTLVPVALLFFTLTGQAQPELKGNPEELRGFLYPNDNILSISADAEEAAYSDQAIVTLLITTEEKQLAKAMISNRSLRETITHTLRDQNVDEANIKNAKFSSSPQYGWFGDDPKSYQVVNRMAVTISAETQLEALAKIADQYEEVIIGSTEFKHTLKEAYNAQVKDKALDKVLAQKTAYETKLGIHLTPIGVRDIEILAEPSYGAKSLNQKIRRDVEADAENYSSVVSRMSSAPASTKQTSFDEIEYRAQVIVDFKIEPATR